MNQNTIQKYECQDPKGRNHKIHKVVRNFPYLACSNCGLVVKEV